MVEYGAKCREVHSTRGSGMYFSRRGALVLYFGRIWMVITMRGLWEVMIKPCNFHISIDRCVSSNPNKSGSIRWNAPVSTSRRWNYLQNLSNSSRWCFSFTQSLWEADLNQPKGMWKACIQCQCMWKGQIINLFHCSISTMHKMLSLVLTHPIGFSR